MKCSIRFMLIPLIIAALPPVRAQDGWFSSASPPIVVRIDGVNDKVNLTNTSEKLLRALTIHVRDSKGNVRARVIADRIEPHKTVAIDFSTLPSGSLGQRTTFTCKNYSKPLKLKYP